MIIVNLKYTRYMGSYCPFLRVHVRPGGSGSSVGIATDYGLDGPGSNPGGDEIFRPSTPAKWVPGLSQGQSAAGACC